MPAPIVIRSEVFRPLSTLSVIQQGPAVYYRELRKSSDPILQTAAWVALLDGKLIGMGEWEALVAASRFGAVRTRAFTYFQSVLEHDLARRVADMDGASLTELQRQQMRAELDNDHANAAELAGAQYVETGDLARLEAATMLAEASGGWRPALQWAVRMMAVSPLSPVPLGRMFRVLESAAQPELLDEIAGVLASRNLHLETVQIFLATAALARGEAQRCLTLLKRLDDARIQGNPALVRYLGVVRSLRAAAEERLGQYKQAYASYAAMNEAERVKDVSPTDFFGRVESRAKLAIPNLPTDALPPVVQMLGFPRSGTTLLENALAAHPAVQTFEEITALDASVVSIEQALEKQPGSELTADAYSRARHRYYEELEAHAGKPGSLALVDKMPIRSADAAFIAKLFPDWRYIFSIRHPFDVVLSCFKQRFKPNLAMENFRTIEGAIRLYDFTMTEWFKRHSLDDTAVHYVRYDELVTDFERIARDTLQFLGVEWNDAVLNFAEAAEGRAARTPSYKKVRQGLSIGVQSSWRNYGFLFQSEAAKPLHRWAEFFGYPTA
jgi:hypothetical protein